MGEILDDKTLDKKQKKPSKIGKILEKTRSQSSDLLNETINPAKTFLSFRDISKEEKSKALEKFQELKESIDIDKTSPHKAVQSIKKGLRELGWGYSHHVYHLDEMLKTKSGNCLGLTLLIGALLESEDIHLDYMILSNPRDAISAEDAETLNELEHGMYFKRENPQLFSLKRWDEELADIERPNRFGLSEHPAISDEGRVIETTNFNTEDYENWRPDKFDAARKLTYKQLTSTLVVEDITRDAEFLDKLSNSDFALKALKKVRDAIRTWPNNYEIYFYLYMIARQIKDENLKSISLAQFLELKSDNARYHYMRYLITDDLEDLKRSYELCPISIDVYLEYSKRMPGSIEDKKFDLAVASYMMALSSERKLDDFYEREEEYIEEIYGEDYYLDLMDGVI